MPVPSGPTGSEHRRERERERGRQNTVQGEGARGGGGMGTWEMAGVKAGSQSGVNTSLCGQSSI